MHCSSSEQQHHRVQNQEIVVVLIRSTKPSNAHDDETRRSRDDGDGDGGDDKELFEHHRAYLQLEFMENSALKNQSTQGHAVTQEEDLCRTVTMDSSNRNIARSFGRRLFNFHHHHHAPAAARDYSSHKGFRGDDRMVMMMTKATAPRRARSSSLDHGRRRLAYHQERSKSPCRVGGSGPLCHVNASIPPSSDHDVFTLNPKQTQKKSSFHDSFKMPNQQKQDPAAHQGEEEEEEEEERVNEPPGTVVRRRIRSSSMDGAIAPGRGKNAQHATPTVKVIEGQATATRATTSSSYVSTRRETSLKARIFGGKAGRRYSIGNDIEYRHESRTNRDEISTAATTTIMADISSSHANSTTLKREDSPRGLFLPGALFGKHSNHKTSYQYDSLEDDDDDDDEDWLDSGTFELEEFYFMDLLATHALQQQAHPMTTWENGK